TSERLRGVIVSVSEQSQSRLPKPLVVTAEHRIQFLARKLPKIEGLNHLCPLLLKPINPPVARINIAFLVARVRDLAVVPVRDVDGAIRTGFDIDGPKPGVAARHNAIEVARFEG